jgi:hypothetical protein
VTGKTVFAVLSFALVAGCGTTVGSAAGPAQIGAPTGVESSAGALPGAAADSTGDASLAGPAQGRPGALAGPGATAGQPVRGGASDVGSQQVPGGAAEAAVGAGAAPLSIGISTWNEEAANQIINAFGGSAQIGDGEAAAKAVIKYLNGSGGIAGRKIQPVFVQFNATSQDAFSTQRQSQCAAFTEDHHVFAVIDQVDASAQATIAGCLARHHTVYVESFMRDFFGQQTEQLAPYVYAPGDLADDGYLTAADELVDSGYFEPGYKLGVLYIDSPSASHLYQSVLKPHLAHDGIKVSDAVGLPNPNGLSDAGPLEQAISSAVLRFQSSGINHVMSLSEGSIAYFMVQAEQQQYRPRYALTSKDMIAGIQSAPPKAQWHRAVLTGWTPTEDVQPQQDPNDRPRRKECLRIIRGAGVPIPGRVAEHFFLVTCDGLFFLRDSLAHAASVTAQSIAAGAGALGPGYASAMTFGTRFGAGVFQGANDIRLAAFDDARNGFVYTKTSRRVRR